MNPALASPKFLTRARSNGGLGALLGVLLIDFAGRTACAATNPPPWFAHALVGMEVGPTGAQFAGGRHAPDYAAHFDWSGRA